MMMSITNLINIYSYKGLSKLVSKFRWKYYGSLQRTECNDLKTAIWWDYISTKAILQIRFNLISSTQVVWECRIYVYLDVRCLTCLNNISVKHNLLFHRQFYLEKLVSKVIFCKLSSLKNGHAYILAPYPASSFHSLVKKVKCQNPGRIDDLIHTHDRMNK